MKGIMMKKAINIIRIATIALWPIIFLLVIGTMEVRFHIRDVLNFQIFYRLLLIPIYIFSGCVFAFNMICEKEFIRQKTAVGAYVFSVLTVILYCVFWVFWVLVVLPGNTTVFTGHAIMTSFARMPIGVFSLVLGLTTFTAIRAVLLYRKAVD